MKKILFTILLGLTNIVYADPTSLAWDAVTTGTDGLPVTITGYKVYQSKTAGVYTGTPIATVTTNTYTFTPTQAGTYFSTVTAYNATGESVKSNEVTYTFSPKVPNAPAGLSVR